MNQETEKIIKEVRGLLIASKFPSTLKQLNDDYRTIIGEKIPFKTLGFKTLAEFLKSAPTLRVFQNSNGDFVVQAEKLPESAHIVDMVEKQKGPKKPPRRSRFSSRGAAVPRNWRPKHSSGSRKYATSSRLAAVSHNQFVDYQKPVLASKIVVPEHSTYTRNHLPPRLQKQNSTSGRLQSLPLKTVQVGNKSVFTKDNTGFVRNTLKDVSKNADADRSCSPGFSRRRKITKMMSEVNLDRDSGNSSPVSDTPSTPPILPPKIPDFTPSGDVKLDLKNFVEYHKLGEIVISTNHINSRRTKMFTCKITIGNIYKVNSYPEEFNTAQAAEHYCTEEAFKELASKYGRKKSLFLASDKDVLERIPKMLEKHNGGLWEWQVRQDYVEKYDEQLPEDWLKIIDSSPCIHVQKTVNNYTLKHCKPEEVLQKGQSWVKSMTLTDVSVPLNTVEFKEDGKLYAEVTFILSANEIWCRQLEIEESDKYLEMTSNMEKHYTENRENLHPLAINRNAYYIAEYENDWYRIRAVDVTETTVLCFCIDFGDEITVPKQKIYQMKREYAVCQAQAFVCRLAGLEDLYEVSAGSEVLQRLQYKQVILEVAVDVPSEDSDVSLPVYMYDFGNGESVNEKMIPLLTLESAAPSIFNDSVTEVYVSNIAANGDIYVQVHSIGYDGLMDLLTELEAQIVSDPPTYTLEPLNKKSCKNRLYLARYNLDDHWYRINIIDWSPKEDLAQIYYIDYGNTEVIKVKDAVFYPLDKLRNILNLYPPQAVKTRILLDEIPKNFATLAKKIVPVDKPVLLKIIKYTAENIPLAEFFSRTSDGGLFCINKSINMETEINKKGEDNAVKVTRKIFINNEVTSKNVPSGGKLKSPTLPDVNNYFDLHVPFAVNPYNFFVQPLESRKKLHKMMEQLQERYKNVTYSPLTIDQIIPGNIYASKFDDDNWYRTSVIKVINNGSISVFYCDFGYYSNLTLQQLIPLDPEFLELPYQALKAKLSGIKPKHSNWTMEHCDEFKKMVERKNFYSILLTIEKDQLYDSDIVLGLLLIDTFSAEDIYIEKELIRKEIAVPT